MSINSFVRGLLLLHAVLVLRSGWICWVDECVALDYGSEVAEALGEAIMGVL